MSAPNPERDAAICDDYELGKSVTEIADDYDLSRERVYQILKSEGVMLRSREHGPTTYLGLKIPAPAKRALEREAKKQGKTLTQLTTEQIIKFLRSLGYSLKE